VGRPEAMNGGFMDDAELVLVRVLVDPDSDAEELADLTGGLRDELLVLDSVSVRWLDADAVPEGAKGIGQGMGCLATQFANMDGLKALLAALHSWSARSRRSVEISIDGDTLKLTSVTVQQQEEIIDAWLARHRTRP
jgi:hypothetical protein